MGEYIQKRRGLKTEPKASQTLRAQGKKKKPVKETERKLGRGEIKSVVSCK